MDQRRLELYDMLKPTLGETPAQKLVLMLPPEAERLATKDDLLLLKDDLLLLKDDIVAVERRLETLIDARLARLDARLANMESTLTRRMYSAMGAWTILVGSAFAWAGVLLR